MSDFSDVDRSAGPDRLVRYLEATDEGLAAMKSYIAAAARRALPAGATVLDLGCGIGHDLQRLEAAGLRAIGLDASAVMLDHARDRLGPETALVRGDGAALPFRASSLDGCRVERVLQHVARPGEVVREVRRVLRPDGWLAVFEPDHLAMRIDSRADDRFLATSLRARHPGIGGELPSLLETHGFRVDDVVTESSFGHSFDGLPVDATAVLRRAVLDGRTTAAAVDAWLDEQRERTAQGTFRATWVKVLVVARAA